MHYYIFRREGIDGYLEYIEDPETMLLTLDPRRARQIAQNDLADIDLNYFADYGFYPLEIGALGLSFSQVRLFLPPRRGYRPPVAPPARMFRRQNRPHNRGLFGRMFGGPAPRGMANRAGTVPGRPVSPRPQNSGVQARRGMERREPGASVPGMGNPNRGTDTAGGHTGSMGRPSRSSGRPAGGMHSGTGKGPNSRGGFGGGRGR